MPHLSAAIGGQLTWYGIPTDLKPTYHAHPMGMVLFLRLRAPSGGNRFAEEGPEEASVLQPRTRLGAGNFQTQFFR
jgi:hypothetical protein